MGIAYAAAIGIVLVAVATTLWIAPGIAFVVGGFLAFAWATK